MIGGEREEEREGNGQLRNLANVCQTLTVYKGYHVSVELQPGTCL